MSKRTLVLSGLFALALLTAVVYFEGVRPALRADREIAASLVHPLQSEIESITITSGGTSFELTQSGGVWQLLRADGVSKAVDTDAVGRLLFALRESRARFAPLGGDDAPTARTAGLSELGLAPPLVTIAWSAGNEELTLGLGRPIPFEPSRVHAHVDGRLASLPLSLLTCVPRWNELEFQARTILPLEANEITGIDLVRRSGAATDRLAFSRDRHVKGQPNSWRMDLPMRARAAPGAVDALCSQLANLKAQGFGAESPTEGQLRAAGLVPAAVELHITREGAAKGTLLLGAHDKESDLVWAHTGSGPISQVRPSLLRSLTQPAASYADQRALLPMTASDVRDIRVSIKGTPTRMLRLVKDGNGDELWRTEEHGEAWAHGLILGLVESLADVRFLPRTGTPVRHDVEADSFRLDLSGNHDSGTEAEFIVEVSGGVSIENMEARLAVRITDRAGRVNEGFVDAVAVRDVLDRIEKLIELDQDEG